MRHSRVEISQRSNGSSHRRGPPCPTRAWAHAFNKSVSPCPSGLFSSTNQVLDLPRSCSADWSGWPLYASSPGGGEGDLLRGAVRLPPRCVRAPPDAERVGPAGGQKVDLPDRLQDGFQVPVTEI